MFASIAALSPSLRRFGLVALDGLMLSSILAISFSLRLGEIWPYEHLRAAWWAFPAMLALRIPAFVRQGLYRAVLRHTGPGLTSAAVRGVAVSSLGLAVVVFLMGTPGFPRSVLFIDAALAMIGVWLSRSFYRETIHHHERAQAGRRERVVIYGAGQCGAHLVQVLKSGTPYRPICFVDDDLAKQRTQVAGLEVLSPEHLASLIDREQIRQVFLAIPSLAPERRAAIFHRLDDMGAQVKSVPDFLDLALGRAGIQDLEQVDEAALLGRTAVPPDAELLHRNITDKSVLVTGAGGSIGSELCRQIASLKPVRLVLLDNSEFNLYRIDLELREQFPDLPIFAELGSVTSRLTVDRILGTYGVQTIYHAAAYKHVHLVESSPLEGVHNNVFGTLQVAEAALSADIETFVLISTDKAVRPAGVMGSTKRVAELICQSLARQAQAEGKSTRFVMVRFGNVLNSAGSVVPLFRRQISGGGPVTVTHRDVVRFFMTIPEASQLVIQAGALGQGGEVYLLDMGSPVRIDDLARRMIRLCGLEPDNDIEVAYTGLRAGEKLFEELLINHENQSPTDHPKIFKAVEEEVSWGALQTALEKLSAARQRGLPAEATAILDDLVASCSDREAEATGRQGHSDGVSAA